MLKAVLILEDEEKLRKTLQKQLSKMDSVGTVSDYSNADELLRELESLSPTPNIGILDINMPGENNGIDALVAIKKKYEDMNVYMFTSSDDPAEHERCRNLGATDVIVKPMGRIAIKVALSGIVNGINDD